MKFRGLPICFTYETIARMKHRKEKSPRIGNAVIRGRKERYEFEVFPLDVEMQPVPAVYVISRRVTDREGRGHHKFVCIGQTESLALELKRQKKGKCIKKFKANVVSVLPTESEKSRFSIEADLKAAHSIPCLHEPENAVRPIEKPFIARKPETKDENKIVRTISPAVVKPSLAKTAKARVEKAEKKIEPKSEAQKPLVVNKKSAPRTDVKPPKVLKEKAATKTKVLPLAETAKNKTAKIAAVKSAKPTIQPPKKSESTKQVKPSVARTPVTKTKVAPKETNKISTISRIKEKSKTVVSKTNKPKAIQKPKVVSVKPSAQKAAPKTVKASAAKKTASKNELKTTKATRKTVTAADQNKKTANSKKKIESPAAKSEATQKTNARRKRLAN